MLAVSLIRTRREFDALAPEWDGLVAAMPRPSPFLLHAWVSSWLAVYEGPNCELCVPIARRSGQLVGALPFVIERAGLRRTATFVGGQHSALADLLLAPGEGTLTGTSLLDAIRSESYGAVDVFGLPGQSRLAWCAGPSLELRERVSSPVLVPRGSWQDLTAARYSAERRREHRRKLRRLQGQGAFQFEHATSPTDVLARIGDCERIFELRRTGRGDGSEFVTEPGRRFNRLALPRLAEAAQVRLCSAVLDERPVAFYLALLVNRQLTAIALGFDPAFERASVGMLTIFEALRSAIDDDGVTRIEFLGGNEAYKRALTDHAEPLYQGTGLASSPMAAFDVALRRSALDARVALRDDARVQRLREAARRVRRVRRPW